ncbi:hypothetical protein ACFFRR_003956 [Megaselia abdita]
MKFAVVVSLFLAVVSADVHLGFPKDTGFVVNDGRVIRGVNAVEGASKYIVSISASPTKYSHNCGGSIIDKEWILTAAHCIKGAGKGVMVYAGIYDKSNYTEGQQRFTDYTIVHPKYPGKVGPNDIALMHVSEPFEFNDKVQPVLLPSREEIVEGAVHLYGWGQTKALLPNSPKVLQTMETDVILYEQCKELLPETAPIHEVNVCSAPRDNKLSACNGDSGGPLVKETEGGVVQIVGVVSWGYIPCGNLGMPSIYTNVASYIEWIASAKADYYRGVAFCAKF